MNQQLQHKRELDFGFGMATSKFNRVEVVNSDRSKLDRSSDRGLQFATAIKAKHDGSRPIIEDVIFATVDRIDLEVGKSWLSVNHHSNFEDRHKPYYSTSITNQSTEAIQIDRFGTYIQKGKTLVLHSITGGFFSSQQFQEWYQLGESNWIEPGQIVTDPNSHSQLGVYWAYFGTSASGQKFVAGSAWNGKPWWQLW
jgi:hypothetical protein